MPPSKVTLLLVLGIFGDIIGLPSSPLPLLLILAGATSPLTLGSSGLYSAPSSALQLVRARPCADVAMAP